MEQAGPSTQTPDDRPFRFFDNREKYLLFVTTTGEKWATAERVGEELDKIDPRPPALSLFDAGMGDGTVLSSVLRQLHERFPTVPFLVVGKEISVEDVRFSLEKLPDRFAEHPQLVVVVTNMTYGEAPRLTPSTAEKRASLNWQEVPLTGTSAHDFDDQIHRLNPLIADWWQVRSSEKTGNPVYLRPSVLVLYREDQRFSLETVIPRKGEAGPGYDLMVAAQTLRARQPAETKARMVLEPLAKALAPCGRLITVQSTGIDPGMAIIRKVWPDQDPFKTPGPMLLSVLMERLKTSAPDRQFFTDVGGNSLFRFALHTKPGEVRDDIATSTLLAAWNAAVYVAQIDDRQVAAAMTDSGYLDTTREMITRYGGLWFIDEAFVIGRKRE